MFCHAGYVPVLVYEEQSAALNSRFPIHRLDRAPIDEDSCIIHAEILKRPLRSPSRFAGGDGPWLAVPVSQLFGCGADSQISGHAKGERTTLSCTGLSSVMRVVAGEPCSESCVNCSFALHSHVSEIAMLKLFTSTRSKAIWARQEKQSNAR